MDNSAVVGFAVDSSAVVGYAVVGFAVDSSEPTGSGGSSGVDSSAVDTHCFQQHSVRLPAGLDTGPVSVHRLEESSVSVLQPFEESSVSVLQPFEESSSVSGFQASAREHTAGRSPVRIVQARKAPEDRPKHVDGQVDGLDRLETAGQASEEHS